MSSPSGGGSAMRWRVLRLSGFVFSCLLLVGCESLSYYSQAVGGQLNLLRKRANIESLIADPATPGPLREKLESVLEIRAFAQTELGLDHGNNFGTYVDLERRFVVWNVFAVPEFSLVPVTWCYPVAGCVGYRGYFAEEKARRYAARLQGQGLDVYVGGVTAYSTLGWFADPLLNTVINRDEHELAGLIFHELAHQLVYVKGDTDFNESFATAVEREGLRRWLETHYEQEKSGLLYAAAMEDFARQEDFVALVGQTLDELGELYASQLDANTMREEKKHAIERLRERYASLRRQWQGYDGYDNWFAQAINNAQLATVATYYRWVPAFEYLLARQGRDLESFYREIGKLAKLAPEERLQALQQLDTDAIPQSEAKPYKLQ